MSVSFDRWRLAQRRQLEADMRLLRRARVVRRPRRFGSAAWRSWWRRHRATVGIAMLAGLALGLAAVDLPTTRSVSRETIVVRGPSDVRSVLDGDTFKAGATSIRLHGIDAPELKQTCDGWAAGEAARHALFVLVTAGTPQCEPMAKDVYGRTVAICRVDGKDVSEAMVRSGMAYAAYSHDYLLQEWRAKFDGLGIHARRCADPADWRASHRK
jgi:endonuclease YncB( thermonuclease family)